MARSSILPIFVPHAGCPHDCVFCNQRRIASTVKPPSVQEVRAIIERGLEIVPPGQMVQAAFYGGSFTAIAEDYRLGLLGAVRPYIESGRIASVRISTRPDCISAEILAQLREYKVETIELGAQSMDERVLSLSKRGHTAQDTLCASKLIRENGFTLILQMMCGLPGQSEDSARDTARRLAALTPDGVRIYPVVVIEDTALAELWRAGEYRPISVDEAAGLCADLLEIFEQADIPVIRVGLNPSEELSGGGALCGAYHPALGELARGQLYLRRARAQLIGHEGQAQVTLLVNSTCVSLMAGQHGSNKRALMEEFGIQKLTIRGIEAQPGSVAVL